MEPNKAATHYINKSEDNDQLKDFSVTKSDPKYQTLPYNTKFTVNIIPSRSNHKVSDTNDNNVHINDTKEPESPQHISSHINGNVQSHMTVHSAPLNAINKNIATPISQTDLAIRKLSEGGREQHLDPKTNYQNGPRTNEIGVPSSSSSCAVPSHQVCLNLCNNPSRF